MSHYRHLSKEEWENATLAKGKGIESAGNHSRTWARSIDDQAGAAKISYAAIYRAIKGGLFDQNKRAASRSKKQAFAYHLRRKGKKQRKKWDESQQDPHFRDANRLCERASAANDRREL